MGTPATRITVKPGAGCIRLGTSTGSVGADGAFELRDVRHWCLRESAEVERLGAALVQMVSVNPKGRMAGQLALFQSLNSWWSDFAEVAIVRPQRPVGYSDLDARSPDGLYFGIHEPDYDPSIHGGQSRKAAGFWMSFVEAVALAEMLFWAAAGSLRGDSLVLPRPMDASGLPALRAREALVRSLTRGGRRSTFAPHIGAEPVRRLAAWPWETSQSVATDRGDAPSAPRTPYHDLEAELA